MVSRRIVDCASEPAVKFCSDLALAGETSSEGSRLGLADYAASRCCRRIDDAISIDRRILCNNGCQLNSAFVLDMRVGMQCCNDMQ